MVAARTRSIALLASLVLTSGCASSDAVGTQAPTPSEAPIGEDASGVSQPEEPTPASTRLEVVREIAADPIAADLPHLIDALGDPDFRVRRDAAGAIAQLGAAASDAVPALAAALGDDYAFVRQRAAWALTRIGDDRAIEALRAWARDIDPDELDHAMDALGTLADAGSVDLIAEWMTWDDPWIRRSAARALVRIGAPSAPAARALLVHDDEAVACAAARVLGYVGTAGEDADRIAVAPSASDLVSLCRLGALARFGDGDAVDRLARAARDSDPDTAEAAVDSLAMAGTPAALNRLIDLLPVFERDDRPGNAAERALIALGDTARAAIAIRVVDVDGGSRALQARVLAVIGDPRDLRPLRQAVDSAHSEADRVAFEDAIAAIEARTPTHP